jgi:hypothetical protein
MRKTWRVAMMVAVLATVSCGDDDEATDPVSGDPTVLVDQQVTVPGNGGAATVSFAGTAGQKIRITLVANPNTIQGAVLASEPYAGFETPGGDGGYHPPLETAANNQNTEEVTLMLSGTYTLSVFDGSGVGRSVHVTVQKIQ